MSSAVQQILGDMARLPGVVAVFVVSKEGFVVEKVVSGGVELDEDAVAAMLTAVHGSSTQLGSELELGRPENITLEFPGHYFLVYDLGREHLLALLADRAKAVLGRLRYEIKKQAPRIASSL